MAAESNMGFQYEESEMISMGNYYGTAMMLGGNSSSSGIGIVQALPPNSSASSLLLDSVSGLKHDTGLAVDWSAEEQCKLEQGLQKYDSEPSIMKYIKIAATLRDKTVRDVALRCRWLTRKRRKSEEHNMGKKVNIRKDKLVESSSKMNMPSALQQNMAVYPFMMHHMDQNEHMLYEVSGISGTASHLLEQNAQDFNKIRDNLSIFKYLYKQLQDNIDLFYRARNNITAILNDMSEMPGIMSHMPPLPVSINEDLANSIFASTTQSMMFGSPSGIQLKQEPRC